MKLAQGQKVTERSRAQIMLIYETSSSSSDQPYKPCLSVSNVRRFDGLNILRHVLFSVMICFVSEHYLSSWPFYDLVTLRQHRLRSLVRRITGANDAVNLCSLCSQKRRSTPCGQQWPFRLLTRSRSLLCYHRSVCRLSHCDDGAPFSAGWNSRHFFFAVWYLGHPLTFPSGNLNARGVAKYSDFWHLECYNSETVPDRRKVSINH